ncbi:C4-dicarboxylate ABC transporter [Endozoicomonas sp. OPT23]|uniref:TRAP transporter substrate-binding protein n=1 Tax=Endozoicomonas sp. OPT23 TaxID=2072845 RepID=UPI00129B5E07|nr:TRAP transporter substrate-binding protein [Endozoicomonas sp. OPT23]MRI35190.1 C4-dicarboxylate ABC transporter [Endozoicomonas sp. OPT23]
MKFVKSLLTAAVACAALTSPVTQAAPIEIKFAHVVAENTPKGKMAIRFEELVEQRLPGQVDVKVYPNSQLFGDNKVLEAMLLGDVQLAAPSLSKFQKYTKQLQLFDLPFLFEDMAAVERFQQSEVGQNMLKSVEKKGLVGMGYIHNGMKQLSAYEPLKLPSDAKGKKFRIQTSDILAAQFAQVGGIPLKKPFSEVFTLLQTKAVDGTENPWSNIYSKKFHEVQPFITESNHGLLDYMVVTSKEFLMGLPADIRPVVEQSLKEAIAYGNKVAAEKTLSDRQAVIDSGRTQVIAISAEERAQWVKAMKPVWKQFEGQVGKDLIQAALDSNKQ